MTQAPDIVDIMAAKMTKAKARAWPKRWQLVNEFTNRQAREASPDQRLKELALLFTLCPFALQRHR